MSIINVLRPLTAPLPPAEPIPTYVSWYWHPTSFRSFAPYKEFANGEYLTKGANLGSTSSGTSAQKTVISFVLEAGLDCFVSLMKYIGNPVSGATESIYTFGFRIYEENGIVYTQIGYYNSENTPASVVPQQISDTGGNRISCGAINSKYNNCVIYASNFVSSDVEIIAFTPDGFGQLYYRLSNLNVLRAGVSVATDVSNMRQRYFIKQIHLAPSSKPIKINSYLTSSGQSQLTGNPASILQYTNTQISIPWLTQAPQSFYVFDTHITVPNPRGSDIVYKAWGETFAGINVYQELDTEVLTTEITYENRSDTNKNTIKLPANTALYAEHIQFKYRAKVYQLDITIAPVNAPTNISIQFARHPAVVKYVNVSPTGSGHLLSFDFSADEVDVLFWDDGQIIIGANQDIEIYQGDARSYPARVDSTIYPFGMNHRLRVKYVTSYFQTNDGVLQDARVLGF